MAQPINNQLKVSYSKCSKKCIHFIVIQVFIGKLKYPGSTEKMEEQVNCAMVLFQSDKYLPPIPLVNVPHILSVLLTKVF